ncbi:(deoxy)nucleoside triphosphate pyrophosphohydrolase [Brevibacillus nitrificans]|uniref:(deoxy)nucleoside triphosphate pyrophosphohydrolase n=1 Tax=Brevibacillus nitrificans TaxID=651560 RepID=UPI00399CB7F4
MKQIDVVGAVIVKEDNKILCALRSQEMSLPGYWEFPGGKIEQGEDPREALIREIKEELSCEVAVGELIEDIIHDYENISVHLITYLATIIHGEPKASEHERLEWVAVNDLERLDWAPADIPTVHKIKRTMLR